LNVWAILSVEYLDHLLKEMYKSDPDVFGSCTWCPTAFSDIYHADLSWFLIITGDGWGALGRPLVEAHPWTIVFFASCIFIIVWGFLNLITAAIVDSSIMAREDDVLSNAKVMAEAQQHAYSDFGSMVEKIDADGDGEISIEEFTQFWRTDFQLQQNLLVMGVEEDDLAGLLRLLDTDGSGTLNYIEFTEQLAAMRNLVVKTNVYYIVKYVESIMDVIRKQQAQVDSIVETLTAMNKTPKTWQST